VTDKASCKQKPARIIVKGDLPEQMEKSMWGPANPGSTIKMTITVEIGIIL